MTSDARLAQTALARNLLSSVLALAFPNDLETEYAAQTSFLAQLPTLQAALERHNVFGLVTDGKALIKWQNRLLQLVEAKPAARRVGWELLLTTTRQSPLERLESLVCKLLERVVKVVKQQQQVSEDDEDAAEAATAACGVAQALLLHVDRFGAETRREVLELLGKLLQGLVALLSSKHKTSKPSLVRAQLELIATLLRVSPNSLRSYAMKIESACVGALFPAADGTQDDEAVARQAAVCLALLCNASDKPQQVWTQMAQKALEAAHIQLDLLAGKRSTATSTEGITGKKIWLQGAASANLPIYQRAEVTLTRMKCALSALRELLSVRTATQSRGQISEREAQQILPEVVLFSRRALAVRAHEVGKHTGVSDDGVRLPVSVVFAVLPRVHAQALHVLSASVERTGLCALRHASKITRVLLLAAESVGDGEDLQALADATAICARRLGASTVEKLGVPLLNELITRCKSNLEEKAGTDHSSNSAAKALAVQQNDAKNGGGKSKKRKRQAAAAATLAALTGGNAAAGQTTFVSMRDEAVVAQSLLAALAAIAGCVSIYGSMLPAATRSSASELSLLAVQRRHVVGTATDHVQAAVDPVTLALLAEAVTTDASGSHAINLLRGIQYWQRRATGSGGASSALQLAALNAGEAMLHPRAPPLEINFQQSSNSEKEGRRIGTTYSASKDPAVIGDAMDWDENDRADDSPQEDSDDDDAKETTTQSNKPSSQELAKTEAPAVTEEEGDDDEEEDYDDVRPTTVIPMEVQL
ncbi:hypothetical protein BBO99_00003733 [Phytophthora kernoviae]|uniref:Pre-rRNA-processing protein RIX1 N-terminal domain-containing protein n=1 Tax=Phytophthora kernoviae TaxID=325452 RepID=A0A3R7GH22_9STRA|nr:hypothetical protein BBI17_003782 [Phytophthora kernoviae]RLN81414.1 hypothetical protein BBO99_00003733 [Phytophthora kernoviae]